jgi:hypothetical protein
MKLWSTRTGIYNVVIFVLNFINIYQIVLMIVVAEQVGMSTKIDLITKSSVFCDITPTILTTCFTLIFLLGSTYEHRDGGEILLRNVGWLSADFLSTSFFPVAPTLVHRASVKRFVSLQFLNLKESVVLLGRVISPSQGRTGQHKHRINVDRHPCLEWD